MGASCASPKSARRGSQTVPQNIHQLRNVHFEFAITMLTCHDKCPWNSVPCKTPEPEKEGVAMDRNRVIRLFMCFVARMFCALPEDVGRRVNANIYFWTVNVSELFWPSCKILPFLAKNCHHLEGAQTASLFL